MIGSTNSIWKVNGKYEQLVNYTMLYDYGDECTDITGGWSNTYNSGSGGTYTENSDNIYLYIKTSSTIKTCAGTENMIDTTPYSKALVNWNYSCQTKTYCKFGCGTKKDIDMEWQEYSPTTLNFLYKGNSNLSGKGIDTFDLSTINQNAYFQVNVQSVSSYIAYLNMYSCALLKPDDWATLASKAGITASSIDDILTNSTTLLSNKEAVEFMIYNCTGDFMASAVQSETFLTALNNSQYKTIIWANEHWAKFLNMVA